MAETVAKKDNAVKDAAILVIITLIAALLLAFVYEITKDPIAAQKAKKKTEAYAAVYPGLADTVISDSLQKKAEAFVCDSNSGTTEVRVDEAVLAKDASGAVVGLLMTVTTPEGYGGDITLTCGVTADGTLTGISFLTLAETAGLGMKAQEDGFRGQFENKKTDSFALMKGGAAVVDGNEPVDVISNATITSEAVVRAVNGALEFAGDILNEGLEGYAE